MPSADLLQKCFADALEALDQNEDSHALVRLRYCASEGGIYERLTLGLAFAWLWRYPEASRLLFSGSTRDLIASQERAWIAEGTPPLQARSAAGGMERTRCDNLGDLYRKKGQWNAAIRWYRQAILWHKREQRWDPSRATRLRGREAELEFTLGELLWKQGSWAQACRHIGRVARSHPDPDQQQEALYALAVARRSEGRYRLAA